MVLGIDSSAYTLPWLLLRKNLDEERQLLTVLRQHKAAAVASCLSACSELSGVLACLLNRHPELVASNLAGVAVSTAPRTAGFLYASVWSRFKSGREYGYDISSLKHTSHQEEHCWSLFGRGSVFKNFGGSSFWRHFRGATRNSQ